MKEIKQHIKNVEGIMQITKAMDMVATAKFKKLKDKSEQAVIFLKAYEEIVHDMLLTEENITSPYVQKRAFKRDGAVLYIIIGGDKGLSGSYNYNVFKLASDESVEKKVKLITLGKKTTQYFKREGFDILDSYTGIFDSFSFEDAFQLGEKVRKMYLDGTVNKVKIYYTRYKSPLVQVATGHRILPKKKSERVPSHDYFSLEPEINTLLNHTIPHLIAHTIYACVLESYTSEQAATRIAMEAASESADEMKDSLLLKYNMARQAGITQEISEIVSNIN